MNKSMKQKVWEQAAILPGKDPKLYRRDPYGNILYKHSYGKTTVRGWEIDHIYPKSLGGSDELDNLQALQTHVNRSKGNSLNKRSRHSGNTEHRAGLSFFIVFIGLLCLVGM